MCLFNFVCVFFFKQKTAYEMRISDWSSDVCSSDLVRTCFDHKTQSCELCHDSHVCVETHAVYNKLRNQIRHEQFIGDDEEEFEDAEIGRASCRERVCQYV